MLWDICNSALTWLEFPVHISTMSQSLTASRQSTPINCSYRDSTIIIKSCTHKQKATEFSCTPQLLPGSSYNRDHHCIGSLSQHTFHAAVLSFSSTLLQKKKKSDYISSVRLMWSWCWCKITHGWASTVTLLSCLYKTISTLWRIQELQKSDICYFAHFYLFIALLILYTIMTCFHT